MAWGSFDGKLNITDMEQKKTFFSVKAHDSIINCIDALGGEFGYGAPEIITGSRAGELWAFFFLFFKKTTFIFSFSLSQ